MSKHYLLLPWRCPDICLPVMYIKLILKKYTTVQILKLYTKYAVPVHFKINLPRNIGIFNCHFIVTNGHIVLR